MIDAEFQAASLANREWPLWVAIAQVAIGAIQTGIVHYGIRAMIGANTERAEAAAAARREADRRHAESMAATLAETTAALKVVVERIAPEAGR